MRETTGAATPTGEAPAVARHGPRGGPYFLQRHDCVFCHTRADTFAESRVVACCTDMDEQRFQAVTCLSRRTRRVYDHRNDLRSRNRNHQLR